MMLFSLSDQETVCSWMTAHPEVILDDADSGIDSSGERCPSNLPPRFSFA